MKPKRLFWETYIYKDHSKRSFLQLYIWSMKRSRLATLDYGQWWLVLNPFRNNKHQVLKIHMLHILWDLQFKYNITIEYCILVLIEDKYIFCFTPLTIPFVVEHKTLLTSTHNLFHFFRGKCLRNTSSQFLVLWRYSGCNPQQIPLCYQELFLPCFQLCWIWELFRSRSVLTE